jgi:DNA-binding transcriptional ArsR family regulator
MARYFVQPEPEQIMLREVMRALGDDVRLRMVAVLSDGEFHTCAPQEFETGVHKSTLSHHFRVLREAGVTSTLIEGRNNFVRLRIPDLDARFPGLLDAIFRDLGVSRASPAASRRA